MYSKTLLAMGIGAMLCAPKGKGKGAGGGAPAPAPSPAVTQGALPPGVKVMRNVTMPSLAVKDAGQSAYLEIRDKMRVSQIKAKAGEQQREPATICTAVNVFTGEAFTFIVPAVVKANLERDYPGDSYVGKQFYVKNMGKRTPGQRYKDFSIMEISVADMSDDEKKAAYDAMIEGNKRAREAAAAAQKADE